MKSFKYLSIFCFSFMFNSGNSQNCAAYFTYAVSGNTVTFTNLSTFSPTTNPIGNWSLGTTNFTTSASAQTVSATFSLNGVYVIGLGLSGPGCSSLYIDTVSLQVPGCPLSLNQTTNSSGVIATTPVINFSNNAIGTTSNSTYAWSFGDGNTSSSANPTHTYTGNGGFSYSLTVTNNATCSALYPIVYSGMKNSINSMGRLEICAFNPSISYVSGPMGQVGFTLNGVANWPISGSWWMYGDGSGDPITGIGNHQSSHTFFNGTFTTSVYHLTSYCPSTASVIITVTNNPCILNSAFGFTAGPGGVVQFSPNTPPSGTNIAYLWNFGDGVVSNALSPNHTYTSAGTYSVSLISSNITNPTGCQQTTTVSIPITGIPCVPNSGFTIWGSGPQTYYIFPSSPYIVSNALWNWGDGSTSSILYSTHTYSAAGFYNICLTVTVSCGSTSSTCVNYFLNKQTDAGMVFVSVVPPELTNSIGEPKAEKLSLVVFPNPSEGVFNIAFDKEINLANISVYDVVGKRINITKFEREGEKYKLVLEDLPSGVYLIKIQTGQSTLRSKVIISK